MHSIIYRKEFIFVDKHCSFLYIYNSKPLFWSLGSRFACFRSRRTFATSIRSITSKKLSWLQSCLIFFLKKLSWKLYLSIEILSSLSNLEFKSLLDDACPEVRCIGVKGICRVLGLYWDLIPSQVIKHLLLRLVNDMSRDSRWFTWFFFPY